MTERLDNTRLIPGQRGVERVLWKDLRLAAKGSLDAGA